MPPKVRGLRFSSVASWASLGDSQNRCSTYSLAACTRCTFTPVRLHPRARHGPLPPSTLALPAQLAKFPRRSSQRARCLGRCCALLGGLCYRLRCAWAARNLCQPAHPFVRGYHRGGHSVTRQQ